MLKQTSLLVAGVVLCVSAWADFSGNYNCKTSSYGKMQMQKIHVKEENGHFNYTLKSIDHNSTGELTSTHLPNRFLSHFYNKDQERVGISAWVFKNEHLTIDKVLYDVENPNAFKERVDCELIN
jgi:hypothetical protein